MHTLGQKFKVYFYTIPTLCACGCGDILYHRGQQYVHGHDRKNIKISASIKFRMSRAAAGRKRTKQDKLKQSNTLKEKYRHQPGINFGKTGELATNWRGGISFLPYCKKFNKSLKIAIKQRDNHTCQLCGATDKKLAVHHVHYDKENCYPDLITLCNSDNLRVNKNRKYHELLFMNKLNDRGLLFWTLSLYKEKTV